MSQTNPDIDPFSHLLEEAEEAMKPTAAGLGELGILVDRMLALEAEQAVLEAKSSEISKSLSEISERDIPSMMDQLKLKELVLEDGRRLFLKPIYIGKIPEDRANEAYKWMEENGYGSMIKTCVEAQFGMGQLERAKELAENLTAAGYVVNATRGVHTQTLTKFIKDSLTGGKEIPTELFNPNVLRRAKVK